MRSGIVRKALLASALMMTIQGCSLYGGEKDVVQKAPLPEIEILVAPDPVWETRIGDGIGQYYSSLRPVVANAVVYAASRDGIVKALSAHDGSLVWETDLSGHELFTNRRSARISGAVTVGQGKVYLGSENALLFALDQETGELEWVVPVIHEVVTQPVLDGGRVLLHTADGSVSALDAETGEEIWVNRSEQPALTLRGVSRPVTASGALFIGRADGRLSGMFTDNGAPIWETRVAMPRGANDIDRLSDADPSPVLLGETLYMAAFNGDVMAVDLRTGSVQWKRNYSVSGDLRVSGNRVYLTDVNGHVFALDRRNGLELWAQTSLSYRLVTAPQLSKGYVVVGDGDGYLHWMSRETGELIGQQLLDEDGIYQRPISRGDRLYVQTRTGKLMAFDKPE